jgi:AcrR family transcriptional regulator
MSEPATTSATVDERRRPLSRDRIAAAALARVDADGLAALSMRKLGTDLGVEAMSLYNHVRNKDDLLVAVTDLLHDEIMARYQPVPEDTWQDKARKMAVAWWQIGREHPKAFVLLTDKPVQAQGGIRMLAACMELFTEAGFTLEHAVAAFQAAAGWLTGTVTQEITMMASLVQGDGFADDEVPPELRSLVDFKRVCIEVDPELRFHNGLEIVIAGIEQCLAPRP